MPKMLSRHVVLSRTEVTDWINRLKGGLNPEVKFDPDEPVKMLREGYEKRGEVIYYVNQRLRVLEDLETSQAFSLDEIKFLLDALEAVNEWDEHAGAPDTAQMLAAVRAARAKAKELKMI